jgi:hypothetical protein
MCPCTSSARQPTQVSEPSAQLQLAAKGNHSDANELVLKRAEVPLITKGPKVPLKTKGTLVNTTGTLVNAQGTLGRNVKPLRHRRRCPSFASLLTKFSWADEISKALTSTATAVVRSINAYSPSVVSRRSPSPTALVRHI